MDEREAMMLVTRAVNQSSDRQISQLDEMMKANLAEQLQNLSQIVDVRRIDLEDLMKILLYTDHQRQSGFVDAMNGNGGPQMPPPPSGAAGPRIARAGGGRPALPNGMDMNRRPPMGGRHRFDRMRNNADDAELG